MKSILALIYIRTILELARDNWTPTMKAINDKCEMLERNFYRKNKALYLQCTSIAREVWMSTKTDKEQFTIEIEPVVCGLYYSVESELKKMKFKPTLINRLYDKYFSTSKCELENKSRELASEVWKNTDNIMMQRLAV